MLTAVQSLRRSISRAPRAVALPLAFLVVIATASLAHSATADVSQASIPLTGVSLASYALATDPCASYERGGRPATGGASSGGVVEVFEDADGEEFDRRARGAHVGSALLDSACEDAFGSDSLRSLREDRRRTRPPNV